MGTRTGASVYAQGHASNGGVTKHFAWRMGHEYLFSWCQASDAVFDDAGIALPMAWELAAGNADQAPVQVHGEELFRVSQNPRPPSRSACTRRPIRMEDGNITMDELVALPQPSADTDAGAEALRAAQLYAGYGGTCDAGPPTLAYFVKQMLVGRMLRVPNEWACYVN